MRKSVLCLALMLGLSLQACKDASQNESAQAPASQMENVPKEVRDTLQQVDKAKQGVQQASDAAQRAAQQGLNPDQPASAP